MVSQNDQDLDFKLNLLNTTKHNQEFLSQLKDILEHHNIFDLATTEQRILKNVLPVIINRFERIYSDNVSLFETLDDEIILSIKENLEVAFELTETLQEILNFIYQHESIGVTHIESVIKHVPSCVLLLADHWKNSSDTYKNTFSAEICKLLEVVKHLYVSFLHLLEFSINVHTNDELILLVEALILICELPKNLHDLDASSVISSWKCFGTVTTKYSAELENCMDLRIPITALCEDIYKVLEALLKYNNMESPGHQLKILTFLIKILFKITDIFYQKVDIFALDLLVFYVKISSLPPKPPQFSEEALIVFETDVSKSLDSFLEHLVMGQLDFKNHLGKIQDYAENIVDFKSHPLGLTTLLCKILRIVATIGCDWCLITVIFIEVIFNTLPQCHTDLLNNCDGNIYQQLIINMSAAILHQDVTFQSAGILLRNILQDDVYGAVLALEVYTLIISNIQPEECLTVFINLLYGVNDLICGFFTNRPETVYLKKFLQRLFRILSNNLKDEVIKLFKPDQYIQIWRFLGFNSLPDLQSQSIINPVVNNTSECIRSICNSCSEDMPPNIAEGLDLLSTVNNLDINDPKFNEIANFINSFWTNNFNCNEMLDNNIVNYFVRRITGITSSCIQNFILSIETISPNLKLLSCKEFYWVPVYKMIYSILSSISSANISEINKQCILIHIADIMSLPLQNESNIQLQETYLEFLKTLNETQKDILNFLLDSLNPNVSNKVFQYLEKLSAKAPLIKIDNHKGVPYKHKCLSWKVSISTNIFPQVKRIKMDTPIPKSGKPLGSTENVLANKISNKTKKIEAKDETRKLATFSFHEAENDSSATEVIERIKGEIKCLIKVCKTDKLTQKNVADLRIVMSQMSSLM